MPDEPELLRLDPASESCFELMARIISEEIGARIDVMDLGVTDPAWRIRLGELSADALLDAFEVRLRTGPRYRWSTTPEG